MRKGLVVVFLAAAASVVVATPGQAIVYGERDGTDHPNVGALIAEVGEDGQKAQICTGTLISPTTFLTAAHCTAYLESLSIPNNEIWVSFEVDVDPIPSSSKLIQGTWVTNPGYNQAQSDTGDLAVVLLSKRVKNVEPASLPPLGFLDDLVDFPLFCGRTATDDRACLIGMVTPKS